MSDKVATINDLKEKVKQFVNERDWEQFHSPKNLSMALSIEVNELMEKFLWVDIKESYSKVDVIRSEVEEEIGDIAYLLLQFCNLNDIDLSKALENKLEINRKKYSIEKSKGKCEKYTKYIE